MRLILHLSALFIHLSVFAPATAAELTLPLRLPLPLLQESLRDALAIRDAAPAEIFRQGDCRFIQLDDLELTTVGDRVLVKTGTRLKFGPEWFGSCYGAIDWYGDAYFDLEPYITPDQQLRYRLQDTQLIDAQGERSLAADLVWKLVARIMQPRLEAFQIDLTPPRREVASVLHNFVPQTQVEELDAILSSARATELKVEPNELSVPLIFDIPEPYLVPSEAPPASAEAPLSADELMVFEQTSQAWDAFLVYVIRTLGLDIEDTDIRIRLLEILLDSRYQAAAILAGEAEDTAGDPTRALFVRTWDDLHALMSEAGQRGLLRGRLLPYLAFVTAGDALFLLDTAAPGLGIEISESGLRRLARAMRPVDPVDPLRFDWNLDPFLQELFDLEPPPSVPQPPPASIAPTYFPRWLDFLIPVAQAEPHTVDLQQLSNRLHHWIPAAGEVDDYRTTMAALLDSVRLREAPRSQLTEQEIEIFGHLVPATALIESCWRQFVKDGEGVSYIRSPSGSIGLMQINPAVWRGIFDVDRLKADVGYNAYAGTRILLRYLRLHARPIAERTGVSEDLARASYAAYNAGPRAAGRFLKSPQNVRAKRVDDKFRALFQALSEGGQVDLRNCSVTPSAAT